MVNNLFLNFKLNFKIDCDTVDTNFTTKIFILINYSFDKSILIKHEITNPIKEIPPKVTKQSLHS